MAARDLGLHACLSRWIRSKTTGPSKKCATLFLSSSAVQVGTYELPVAQKLSEISKISDFFFLISSGTVCNIQLHF